VKRTLLGFVAGACALYAFLTWGMWPREQPLRHLRSVS
jgi:hypothetical protein